MFVELCAEGHSYVLFLKISSFKSKLLRYYKFGAYKKISKMCAKSYVSSTDTESYTDDENEMKALT